MRVCRRRRRRSTRESERESCRRHARLVLSTLVRARAVDVAYVFNRDSSGDAAFLTEQNVSAEAFPAVVISKKYGYAQQGVKHTPRVSSLSLSLSSQRARSLSRSFQHSALALVFFQHSRALFLGSLSLSLRRACATRRLVRWRVARFETAPKKKLRQEESRDFF